MNWVVWEKNRANIRQWCEESPFLIAYQEGVWKKKPRLTSMENCSLVVLNAEHKNDIVNGLFLPPSFSAWCADARLWAHIGGVDDEPKDGDWQRFDNDIRYFPGLLGIKDRKAFGSKFNFLLKRDVASAVSKAIRENTSLNVESLFAAAWVAAETQAKTVADEHLLEVLFPLYLLLTHPNQKGIGPAVKATLNAANEIAQTLPLSEQTLVLAVRSLAKAQDEKKDIPEAATEFCRHFKNQAEQVTHSRCPDLPQP